MKKWLTLCTLTSLLACNSNKDKAYSESGDLNPGSAGLINLMTVQHPTLPAGVSLKGNIHQAWTWDDSLGKNALFLTEVPPYDSPGVDMEDGQTAELYAAHFIDENGQYRQVAMISAFEKDCPLDITCAFIPGSTTITDLDSNGIAEIKVQYEQTCRGDVSPANMKLVMIENGRRFTLSGSRWVNIGEGETFTVTEENVNLERQPKSKDDFEQMMFGFGRYESEKDFDGAPDAFRLFARKEWLKYAKENINRE